jgi:hypothetical protein
VTVLAFGQHLRVGKPRVVVDDRVHDVVTEAQILACSEALSIRGERCGLLERSNRRASERRSSALASRQRRDHVQAVVGEKPWRLAAFLIEQPRSIALRRRREREWRLSPG